MKNRLKNRNRRNIKTNLSAASAAVVEIIESRILLSTTITAWSYSNYSAVAVNLTPSPSTGTGTSSSVGMSQPGTATPGLYPTAGATGPDVSTLSAPSGASSDGSTGFIWKAVGSNGWNTAAGVGTQGAQFLVPTTGYGNISLQFDWGLSGNTANALLAVEYTTDANDPTPIWTVAPTGSLNTTTLTGSTFSVATVTNTNAADTNQILGQYYQASGSSTALKNGWANGLTVDFSSIPAANNNPNFGVRIVNAASGADAKDGESPAAAPSNTSANWRFDEVKIIGTVASAPVITTQPTNQAVTTGSTATFTAAATATPSPTVQWQVSTDGVTFNNDTTDSGNTTTTLSVVASSTNNNYQYRAVFTSAGISTMTSAATLSALAAPVITTQPASQSVAAGSFATFTAAASGTPTPTAQWQSSPDGINSWTDISGATSTTYTLVASTGISGTHYRAVFTNTQGTAMTDGNATLTAAGTEITGWNFDTSDVTSAAIAAGTNLSPDPSTGAGVATTVGMGAGEKTDVFAATLADGGSSDGASSNVWRVRGNNGWSSTASIGTQGAQFKGSTAGYNAITVYFDISITTQGEGKFQVQYTTDGTNYVNASSISVGSNSGITVLTNDPSAGGSANTVTGSYFDAYNASGVQTWYKGLAVSLSGIPAASNDPNFGIRIVNAATGTDCVNLSNASLNNTSGNWRFDEVQFTGTAIPVAPAITTQPTGQATAIGSNAIFTAAASGVPAPTVQWKVSTDGGATFNNDTIDAGNTTNSLTVVGSSTNNNYEYEAVYTNAAGSATTNPATLTVTTVPTITLSPASRTVGAGTPVSLTAAATGNPTPSVQWKISTDGGLTFHNDTTDAGNTTTSLSFVATEGLTGDQYEAVFTNGSGSATTTPATLTVTGTPIAQWNFTAGIGAPAAANLGAGTGNSPYPTFGPLSNSTQILGLNNDYTGVQSYPESDIIPLISGTNANFSELIWRIRGGSGLGPTGGPGKPDGWSQNAPEYANVDSLGHPLNTSAVQGVQFSVDTTGYTNVTLHFDWDQSGISDMQPQYLDTVSGSPTYNTWVNVPGNSLITATGSDYYGVTKTTAPTGIDVNLQGVAAANNNSNFQFRLVTAYNTTLPLITDGNALDPTVHGQYATGAPTKVNAQQVFQFNSGIADGETVALSYNSLSASFTYSSTPATLIANMTAALNTLVGSGNFSILPTNYTNVSEASSTLLQPVRDELGIQNSDMTVTFIGALAAKPVATITTTDTNAFIATWVNGSASGFAPFVDGGGSWELGNISFNGDSAIAGALGITANPAAVTQAGGYPVVFSASAYSEAAPVTAQWQFQLPNQTTWNNVANDGSGSASYTSGIDVSGAATTFTSAYTFNTLSDLSQDGYKYRCVFTNVIGGVPTGSVNSQPAALTVVPPVAPVIIFNPSSQSVVEGNTVQFNATASGAPVPTVQWQYLSSTPGSIWQNLTDSTTVAGSQSNTLTLITASDGSQNGYQFQAVFTNGIGNPGYTTSAAALLTVLKPETTITNWDFGNYTAGTFTNSPAPTGGLIDVGTATPIGMTLPYNPADPATGTSGTGSFADADILSSPAIFYAPGGTLYSENTWRIRGGDTPTGGGTSNGWSNFAPEYTQGAEFDVPTTGFDHVFVTLDWFSTHSGELDAQKQYTLDGTNWINLGSPIQDLVAGNDDYYGDSTSGISPVVFDLTQIPGAANDSHFGVRLVNSYNVYLSNVQSIELADSNSFTLSITPPGSATQTSVTIPGSSSITASGLAAEALAIQSAVGGLAGVGGVGNVAVQGYIAPDGTDLPQFTLTFGGALTTIVPTLVASDSNINQNIVHTYQYANAQLVGAPPAPVPYNGSKGNWRLDNIAVHGQAETTTTLTDNGPNPSTTAQGVTFNATVSPVIAAAGNVADGELVTLEDSSNGNAVVGSGTLAGGSATINVAAELLSAGAHSLVAVYGGDPSFDPSISSAVVQNVTTAVAAAPTLTTSQIGDGSDQRSVVSSFTVIFSAPVSFGASSFTLYRAPVDAAGNLDTSGASGQPVDVSGGVTASPSGDGKTWIITVIPGGSLDAYQGAGTDANFNPLGALTNGIYQLVLHGSAITAVTGGAQFNAGADSIVPFASVEAQQNATTNPDNVTSNYFHVLYGDINGDGFVDGLDLRNFKLAFGSSNNAGISDPDTNWQPGFDFNGDGFIDGLDLRTFKLAFGSSYFY